MAKLFPVIDVPGIGDKGTAQYDTEYRRSAAWDVDAGDFIRDGSNRIVMCNGQEAYKTWCYKIVETERYRCLAYDKTIGAEMERAMKSGDAATVESMVKRTITDAIAANPRTEWVRDFDFTWDGDEMHCSCTVKGTGIDAFKLSI